MSERFNGECVCGGSRERPNPDCERCRLLAALAAAERGAETAERERDAVADELLDMIDVQHGSIEGYVVNVPDVSADVVASVWRRKHARRAAAALPGEGGEGEGK
jgi:hypothetical protein